MQGSGGSANTGGSVNSAGVSSNAAGVSNNTAGGSNNSAGSGSAGAKNMGGSGGGGGSASSTGGSGGGGGAGTGGGAPVIIKADCTVPVTAGLPASAPKLTPGKWTDITPADHVALKGTAQTMIAQGIALDPCQPTTIYWCTTPFDTSKGGLFKSTDAGATWRRIGKVTPDYSGIDHLDEPLHVRVDPKDSQHLYVGDGVRGGTQGFWVSHDGGETFAKPPGWVSPREHQDHDDGRCLRHLGRPSRFQARARQLSRRVGLDRHQVEYELRRVGDQRRRRNLHRARSGLLGNRPRHQLPL